MNRGSSPALQHPRQPVDRRVGVAAAQTFDERTGDVVMLVAAPVVVNALALDRLLGEGAREAHRPLVGGQDAHLERGQRPPGVAVADLGEKVQRLVRHLDGHLAQSAFCVRQGAEQQGADGLPVERLEAEDRASAEQRAVDGEERIVRRGADQDDPPFLHVGQQNVLLRAVEVVDLVDEQDGARPAGLQFGAGALDDLAQILDPGGDGVDGVEVAARPRWR